MSETEPTIVNPNALVQAKAILSDLREDGATTQPVIRTRRIKMVDPDEQVDRMVTIMEAEWRDVDAVLLERPHPRQPFKPAHYRNLREYMRAPSVRRRILENYDGAALRDLNDRVRGHIARDKELRESRDRSRSRVDKLIEAGSLDAKFRESDFYMGLYSDEQTGVNRSMFPIQDTVLPTTNSPQSKQQLFMDYLDMHRKSWEAATRNPIGKRICDIIPQFVLGRGLIGDIESPVHQKAWNEFWKRNKMRARMRQVLKELLVYGEIFLRYFMTRDGLVVRSLDPSTIMDIVTKLDDPEEVYYYHQQYTVMDLSPIPYARAVFPSRLVIRQIPAQDISHFKINSFSSEKRGRSQLYSILGWLLRFKEFANDRVLLNKMRAMFALDVSVDGTAEDVASAEAQFNVPPGSGAVLVHNKVVEVEYKNANNNANEAKTDAEMILTIIAIGAGVSQQFLGVTGSSTRAGALIQTEPDVKNFETYQEICEDILDDSWTRLSKTLPAIDKQMEFTFPSLAQEDRHTKLQDIAFAESMDYFSKERAATTAAREFGVTNYDFDAEQKAIMAEREQDPLISTAMQQVPKVAPDPLMGAEEPGLGQDLKPGGELPAAFRKAGSRVTQTSGQMGFSAKRLSGRSPANTQATLNRSGFSRGEEKARIRTNKTAGTPLRASGAGRPRHVWNDDARVKALATRRANAQKRLAQLGEVQRPKAADSHEDPPEE